MAIQLMLQSRSFIQMSRLDTLCSFVASMLSFSLWLWCAEAHPSWPCYLLVYCSSRQQCSILQLAVFASQVSCYICVRSHCSVLHLMIVSLHYWCLVWESSTSSWRHSLTYALRQTTCIVLRKTFEDTKACDSLGRFKIMWANMCW